MSKTQDWREEALVARAALYLLKVATARPDLPRVDAWHRESAIVSAAMAHGCTGTGRICSDEWRDLDWRRDTLAIMTTDHLSDEEVVMVGGDHWRTFRTRILDLLDGP